MRKWIKRIKRWNSPCPCGGSPSIESEPRYKLLVSPCRTRNSRRSIIVFCSLCSNCLDAFFSTLYFQLDLRWNMHRSSRHSHIRVVDPLPRCIQGTQKINDVLIGFSRGSWPSTVIQRRGERCNRWKWRKRELEKQVEPCKTRESQGETREIPKDA